MKTFLSLLLPVLFPVLSYTQVPGSLDSTYGINGIQELNAGTPAGNARAVCIQSDGKAVFGGFDNSSGSTDIVIARLNTDGSFDTTFANNGTLITGDASTSDDCYEVLINQSGQLISCGSRGDFTVSRRMLFARFNDDGTPDMNFNQTGELELDFTAFDEAVFGASMQPDSKIVAAGYTFDINTFSGDGVVVRINNDGTPDSTFGINGIATFDYGDYELLRAVEIMNDGRILIAGNSSLGGNQNLFVMRLHADGSIDSTFNATGFTITDVNIDDEGWYDIAIDNQQRIVLAGYTSTSNSAELMIARLDSSGVPDNTFATNGFFRSDFGFQYAQCYSIILRSDGSILAGGQVYNVENNMALFSFSESGMPDPSFGVNGVAALPDNLANDAIYKIAQQQDEKIVAAGIIYSGVPLSWTMLAARFNPPLITSVPFTDEELLFSIHPNPASERIFVTGLKTDQVLRVYNNTGALVRMIRLSPENASFNTEDLPEGLYYAVFDSDYIRMKKFIVSRD